MCGLIGIITSEMQEGDVRDPRTLVEQARCLRELPLEVLETSIKTLDKALEELFAFPSLYACIQEESRREAVALLGQILGALATELEKAKADATHVDIQEKMSACGIRARDLAWRLEQDFLPNLAKVTALAGPQTPTQGPPTSGRIYVLWQLNTLLNGLDRLEVRGRDSAGIALHVYFPSAESFSAFTNRASIGKELCLREAIEDFSDRAIRRTVTSGGVVDGLAFALKVANEIGEMGENVAGLRARIAADDLLQGALDEEGVRVGLLAHTRWASNGIVSEPNCHPMDNAYLDGGTSQAIQPPHQITAMLNGDIDNYQPLKEALLEESACAIPPAVTTDAKLIPLWIDRYLRQEMDFEQAFRHAVRDFQGSMAIAVQTTLYPGRTFLALRGSGQSLYIGLTSQGYVFASELYGLVEETRNFIKMDGEKERVPGDMSTIGQIAVLDSGWKEGAAPSFDLSYYDGSPIKDTDRRVQVAEITTRDINRAGHPHFMLKEITESVGSVRKTIHGKYVLEDGRIRFTFMDDTFTPALRERVRSGGIRRIYCVGQGTAAVAAQGIATLMNGLLANAPVVITAIKATELSGFWLRNNMDDTLVIAVSQSGTTTDTNRTVDMARERGAAVLAIVNRRNSDLVYKADAVFYTSDGRDVEMSVASTKAFYAQIAAGYLLALAFAQLYGALDDNTLLEDIHQLERLPALIGEVLEDHGHVKELAETWAVRRRHWAVVGNGSNKVSANEIRIKLSELCYKAIAYDVTEDKKHIDLSSEPLILVCAAGLSQSNLQDVVKEVAIFKAHKARPIVITIEGEQRFDPYAEGVIYVPDGAGRLAFVLTTVAGHLWGYYAARALDSQAQRLRKLRAKSVALYEDLRAQAAGASRDVLAATLRAELTEEISQLENWLVNGIFDSGLTAATAVKLHAMLHMVTGRLPLDDLVYEFGGAGLVGGPQLFEAYVAALTSAINDLTRPIDAIKHQAKTVTVGISRAIAPTGVVFDVLQALGVTVEAILPSHVDTLHALSPLVESVTGSVRYVLEGLSVAGDPGPGTRIRVIRKTGVVQNIRSRADAGGPLIGSKRLIAMERRIFVGVGSSDGKTLVLFPLIDRGRLSGIMLLHVRFRQSAGVEERLTALRHYRNRYEHLKGYITELNVPWNDALLARLPIELLFEGSPEAIAIVVQQPAV